MYNYRHTYVMDYIIMYDYMLRTSFYTAHYCTIPIVLCHVVEVYALL